MTVETIRSSCRGAVRRVWIIAMRTPDGRHLAYQFPQCQIALHHRERQDVPVLETMKLVDGPFRRLEGAGISSRWPRMPARSSSSCPTSFPARCSRKSSVRFLPRLANTFVEAFVKAGQQSMEHRMPESDSVSTWSMPCPAQTGDYWSVKVAEGATVRQAIEVFRRSPRKYPRSIWPRTSLGVRKAGETRFTAA
jgi:hypothetical protein